MKNSESEARAQAFVSGFCISDGRGMLGRPHGPWTNLALCGFGPNPIVFCQSVGWEDSFQVVTSGVQPKEELQRRALWKSEGTTRTTVKNWGLGAWQAKHDVSPSSH